MRKLNLLLIGIFLDTNSEESFLESDFRNLQYGLFTGNISAQEVTPNFFEFKGTLNDRCGKSEINGNFNNNIMVFKKIYRGGLYDGQTVSYTLAAETNIISASFTGSWENDSGQCGKAICNLVY
jgi:hypothetical protein